MGQVYPHALNWKKVLRGLVPRGGIEPPTPGSECLLRTPFFSGEPLPHHPNRNWLGAASRVSLMPRFDLRQNDGTLHPLAPFKVLAVMCHPKNRIQREKMLGNIQQETGVSRFRRELRLAEVIDTNHQGCAARHPAWAAVVQAIVSDKRLSNGLGRISGRAH
jgi:hypothetical protein